MYKIAIIEKIHIQKKIMHSNSFVIKNSEDINFAKLSGDDNLIHINLIGRK